MDQILVPRFSDDFERRIVETVLSAQAILENTQIYQAQAEQTLLRALGLENWQPPEPLTYTRRASEALAAGRIDSEYFAPRVAQLLAKLAADGLTIGDVAPARHEAFDPKAPQARPIPAQGNALGIRSHKEQALKGRLNPGVLSRPDGALSCITPEPRALPWAGIGQAVGPEASALASDTFQYIEIGGMRGDGTATTESITRSIRAAHAARQEAQSLLERAKRAVEIAIEEGEAAGMEFLKTK